MQDSKGAKEEKVTTLTGRVQPIYTKRFVLDENKIIHSNVWQWSRNFPQVYLCGKLTSRCHSYSFVREFRKKALVGNWLRSTAIMRIHCGNQASTQAGSAGAHAKIISDLPERFRGKLRSNRRGLSVSSLGCSAKFFTRSVSACVAAHCIALWRLLVETGLILNRKHCQKT